MSSLPIDKGTGMNTVEIKKMSTVERLQAMEMIWDSLLQDEVEIKSPGWHQGILKKRIEKINNGEARFLSLQELKTR